MMILDSQIHAFYADTPEHPWPAGAQPIHGPEYPVEKVTAVLDAHGVQGAVLVPPSWNGWDNDYSVAAARREPRRFAVMGRFNIELPEARTRLATVRQDTGMNGVRMFIQGNPWMSLLTEELAWFWQIAEETRLPVMSHIPGNIAAFGPILERFPDLRLIIDHAGRHPRGALDDAAWADAQAMYDLAKYKNVGVKVSSLPCFTTQAYPYPVLHPHVRAIYDHFGPQRMMWGSDVTRLTSSYADNIRLFTEAIDFLSTADKEWIMGRALAQAIDWAV